ncbi:MAG: APC family permease [Bacteroidota bacterium]|nr:APC family permease [Bacteroidota bacterium]
MNATRQPKRLRTLQLIAVIFLTVSGGPYGLEPLLVYANQHAALLLLLMVPLLWDVPAILTVLELNSMMPVEGGYYQWVKRGLGLRWAFYEGWWTWLYTFADLAIYPVLFSEYILYFFPAAVAYKIPIGLLVIWSSAVLNITGIVPVGKVATVLSVIVIMPFLILIGTAVTSLHLSFHLPKPSLQGMNLSAIGISLYTIIWNFIGWDNATTYAGEVEKPVRSYIITNFVVFALVLCMYLLTVFTVQQIPISPQILEQQGFPAAGERLAGYWLGALLAVGGLASAMGLFSSVLLSVSRVPKVMADDKLLPKKLNTLHPKFNTPYLSIIICAIVVSFMMVWSLEELFVIDVMIYGAGLFVEFITLIALRKKEPDAHRPFKIPVKTNGLYVMIFIPLAIYCIAVIGSLSKESAGFAKPVLFAVVALLSAEVAWQMIIWKKNKRIAP